MYSYTILYSYTTNIDIRCIHILTRLDTFMRDITHMNQSCVCMTWLTRLDTFMCDIRYKMYSYIHLFYIHSYICHGSHMEMSHGSHTHDIWCVLIFIHSHIHRSRCSLWLVCQPCHTYESVVRVLYDVFIYSFIHVFIEVVTHLCVSHVTHVCEPCHTCVWAMSHIWISHVCEPCHTYESVVCVIYMMYSYIHSFIHSFIYVPGLCHGSTHSCVIYGYIIWMNIWMNEYINLTCVWAMSHIWISCVRDICDVLIYSFIHILIHICAMAHVRKTQGSHMDESWLTYEWHMNVSHISHMNESWLAYEWVMAHI